jgi:hypothetical protein
MLNNQILANKGTQMSANEEMVARSFYNSGFSISSKAAQLLNDANVEDSLMLFREKLAQLPDGEYEFSIIDNGLPLDFPGMQNPAEMTKSGVNISCKYTKSGLACPVTDVRDIAGFSLALLNSGKVGPRVVVSLKRAAGETIKPEPPAPAPTPEQDTAEVQPEPAPAPATQADTPAAPDADKPDYLRMLAVGVICGAVGRLTTGKNSIGIAAVLAGSGFEYYRQNKK